MSLWDIMVYDVVTLACNALLQDQALPIDDFKNTWTFKRLSGWCQWFSQLIASYYSTNTLKWLRLRLCCYG